MRIGVDIDGANMRLGIVDGGLIFRQVVAPTQADKSENEIVDQLIQQIYGIINSNIRGIGIGVSGVVKPDLGIVQNAINIPSWKEVRLKDILEEEFKIPIFVNNDSNCFAFGERYYGEGTPYRNIVCVTLGMGVGAGIIINDELYRGNNYAAGEIGSLPYLYSDYEHYCGEKFFIQNGTTSEKALHAVLGGEKDMLDLWIRLGGHVGSLIKTILFMYDPQAIILGGSMLKGYELFANNMFERIHQFPFKDTVGRMKLILSKREDINLLGAASLVI